MLRHPDIPYSFWSNYRPGMGNDRSFWCHDDPACLLAARLEGYELYRRTSGNNPDAICRQCKKPFIKKTKANE